MKKLKTLKQLFIFSVAAFLLSCQAEPEKINFGEDHCDFCKMSIVDPKFGAELVSDKGRVFKFDAVECMIPFMNENKETNFEYVLVIAFDQPEELVAVDQLTFAHSESYKSPMGANITAFRDKDKVVDNAHLMDWDKLKQKRMQKH